jgi:hypothetical protein
VAHHLYPASAQENPTTVPSPYSPGTSPDSIVAANLSPTAANVALNIWEQVAIGVSDTPNLDLDADRGYLEPCWSTNGSINADPITANTLAYGDL